MSKRFKKVNNQVDFVKLDGNLKVDGVSKFTDNLFFCSQTNDSPAEPEITALSPEPHT